MLQLNIYVSGKKMYKNKILCAQKGSVCLFLWPWYVYWYTV